MRFFAAVLASVLLVCVSAGEMHGTYKGHRTRDHYGLMGGKKIITMIRTSVTVSGNDNKMDFSLQLGDQDGLNANCPGEEYAREDLPWDENNPNGNENMTGVVFPHANEPSACMAFFVDPARHCVFTYDFVNDKFHISITRWPGQKSVGDTGIGTWMVMDEAEAKAKAEAEAKAEAVGNSWTEGTVGNCQPTIIDIGLGSYSRTLEEAKAKCEQTQSCKAVYVTREGVYQMRYCSAEHEGFGWCNKDIAHPRCNTDQGGVTYFKGESIPSEAEAVGKDGEMHGTYTGDNSKTYTWKRETWATVQIKFSVTILDDSHMDFSADLGRDRLRQPGGGRGALNCPNQEYVLEDMAWDKNNPDGSETTVRIFFPHANEQGNCMMDFVQNECPAGFGCHGRDMKLAYDPVKDRMRFHAIKWATRSYREALAIWGENVPSSL